MLNVSTLQERRTALALLVYDTLEAITPGWRYHTRFRMAVLMPRGMPDERRRIMGELAARKSTDVGG